MVAIDFSSMFLLGLLGTGHCIGMCGPLVFALPGQTGRFGAHLAYHAGRLGTYTLIGALMGAVGGMLRFLAGRFSADPLTGMAVVQVFCGFLAGGFLIVLGLARLGLMPEPAWMSGAGISSLPGIGRLMRSAGRGTGPAMLASGTVMGFLPCGLSLGAFARALAVQDVFAGGALTLVFGLGTLPGLLLLGSGLAPLIRRYRRQSDLVAGMLMIGMAAALVIKSLAVIAF